MYKDTERVKSKLRDTHSKNDGVWCNGEGPGIKIHVKNPKCFQ